MTLSASSAYVLIRSGLNSKKWNADDADGAQIFADLDDLNCNDVAIATSLLPLLPKALRRSVLDMAEQIVDLYQNSST